MKRSREYILIWPSSPALFRRLPQPSRSRPRSKNELRARLNQPWSRRAHHLSKRCAADIAVNGLRSEELRVIENIEAFQPEL
jgi:hypothetical protein